MRWSVWAAAMCGEALVRWVRDEVFPFFAAIADDSAPTSWRVPGS